MKAEKLLQIFSTAYNGSPRPQQRAVQPLPYYDGKPRIAAQLGHGVIGIE
jgi:hypothetical protein